MRVGRLDRDNDGERSSVCAHVHSEPERLFKIVNKALKDLKCSF